MIAIRRPSAEFPAELPILEPGQLVCHRRYGYRGVVVKRDDCCQADDTWYFTNQTQPRREQPWYHLLVHGSTSCTYAAAENLAIDTSGLPIAHPLVPRFFSEWKDGTYVRNSQSWPQ